MIPDTAPTPAAVEAAARVLFASIGRAESWEDTYEWVRTSILDDARKALRAAAAAAPEPTAPDDRCTCVPCPGRGNDGHGMTHCAECCMGTGIEDADPDCPVPAHRALAERQHGPAPDDLQREIESAIRPRTGCWPSTVEVVAAAVMDVLRQRGVIP